MLKLTNNPWVIRPALMRERLGVDRFTIVNDFGAVAHAVGTLPDEHFRTICGPDRPLPAEGVISIVGPGTGLGVAALLRSSDHYHVIESKGGTSISRLLTSSRIASLNICAATFGEFGRADRVRSWLMEPLRCPRRDRRTSSEFPRRQILAAAIAGTDSLAIAALDRLCLTLGAVAGDMALAQGAVGVVIVGGVGLRIVDYLPKSGFRDRFIAKGRFERRMDEMPVKLITHPEPGLFGAAAAFAREYP